MIASVGAWSPLADIWVDKREYTAASEYSHYENQEAAWAGIRQAKEKGMKVK